ncbi:hypothetical protein P3T17_004692 [Paraburkholderia sp. GAS82]|jgi:hypothetical protein
MPCAVGGPQAKTCPLGLFDCLGVNVHDAFGPEAWRGSLATWQLPGKQVIWRRPMPASHAEHFIVQNSARIKMLIELSPNAAQMDVVNRG